uniref:Venom lipase 2 n=1 Tax=Ectomocoris sp. TaxID=3104572 RepID=A0AB38ZED3_9HEMI
MISFSGSNFLFGKILLFGIISLVNIHYSSETKELLRLAKCLVPKGIDHITRALLLQQCISKKYGENTENRCFKELGCFPMNKPWTTLLRPFPTPFPPEDVDTKITLYTRKVSGGFDIQLWPNISLEGSDYNKDRVRTVFITHGFSNNGTTKWLLDLKDVYLKAGDINVFIVDWADGANVLNYLQAASNIRIVGAELVRFGKYLVNNGLKLSKVHLIGHSLGAHIMGYMGKGFKESNRIGRITALDPAQPGFETAKPEVKLNKEDAIFVDAIHSDAKPFIPLIGFGMMQPIAHVDFYMNGGAKQPGCLSISLPSIKSLLDLLKFPVEVLYEWVGCSHGRATEYFIWALKLRNCTMWGRKMSTVENLLKITSIGTLSVFDPLIKAIGDCDETNCSPVGFNTFKLKARGAFAVSTSADEPYCNTPKKANGKLSGLLGGIFGILTDTLQQLKPFR